MKFNIFNKNDDEKIAILFSGFFSFNLITLLVNTIVNFFAPNTPIDTIICLLIYAYIIAATVGAIIHRVTIELLILPSLFILFYIINFLIFEDNISYLSSFFPKFIFTMIPLYFLGATIQDYKLILNYFERTSRLLVFVGFLYYVILITTKQTLVYDNMSFAYYYLPFAIISFYSLITSFSVGNFLRVLLSCVTLLLTGTRGPILCLGIGCVLFILFAQKNTVKKVLLIVFVIIFCGIFLNNYILLGKVLSKVFQLLGIENRILNKIFYDGLFDGSGRDNIIMILKQAIQDGPILGYGLMGDRVLTDTYAHNLLFELLIDFGVVVGSTFFVVVSLFVLRLTLKKNISFSQKTVFLIVVACSFVKLMISGSYIQEQTFFLLIGMMVGGAKIKRETYNDGFMIKKVVKNR